MEKLIPNKDAPLEIVLIWIILVRSVSFPGFKSFRRLLIYLLHHHQYIDLKNHKSEDYDIETVLSIFQDNYDYKISKNSIYGLLGISKNTFNKMLNDYLIEHNLKSRKTLTIIETYHLLVYWEGDKFISRFEAITKKELANILTNGDYKKLAEEFIRYSDEEYNYKNCDKLAPREAKLFLRHIDADNEVIQKIFKIPPS